eukprot:CAMPEP_0172490658 /NCGR_PEP_ID=MMETSP1066-20121228/21175_1 /TAXON_ID=671091 /ORGANISM="Coscinodiscus wailesii, Strain CCMP2513" /LENGTH=196 /DNA_ID=CAMNT_0013259251 /DNA_START=117 /DNA_END=707 /DNA_ORIENTATION=-
MAFTRRSTTSVISRLTGAKLNANNKAANRYDPKGEKNKVNCTPLILKSLILIVVVVVSYVLFIPYHVRSLHLYAVNNQLVQVSESIGLKGAYPAARHDELEKKIELEKQKLAKEKDTIDASNNQNNIDASSNAEIKEEKEFDKSSFCDDCEFNHLGLRVTCGKRKEYFMSHYGDSEDVAIKAVMTRDPNCKKSQRR